MTPLLWGLAALGAGLIGWKAIHPRRFVGDLAKPGPLGTLPGSGDQVEVMVPDLMKANASVQQGTAPGQIPPGVQTVIVHVLGAKGDVLQGPITTMGNIPLGQPIGAVLVNRKDVKAVYRNVGGTMKVARDASGNFAGERAKRFMG